VQNPSQALKSLKEPGTTFNLTSSGKELWRHLTLLHGIFRGSPQTKTNIKVDI
jgi:hypothetical protein